MSRVKEVAEEQRFVRTKTGIEDLQDGGTPMSLEEWHQKCIEANPLDSYLKEQRQKEEAEQEVE